MSVKIRKRKLKENKVSLYLDIYLNGHRTTETLGDLYLYERPKSPAERNHNSETNTIVETLKIKKENQLIDNRYQFANYKKTSLSFLEYFKLVTEARKGNDGNYGNWDSTYKVLLNCPKIVNKNITEVTEADLNSIKEYISNVYRTKADKKLSQNAASSYFNKVKTAINKAFDDKIIFEKVGAKIQSIVPEETIREYVTLAEIALLEKTDCESEALKRAFLFSVYTGLRWSDIMNLKWGQVQNNDGQYFIKFHHQKTKAADMVYLNKKAISYMGSPMEADQKIFKGLKYSAYLNLKLSRWMLKANITRNVTFHCARHTFATQVLAKGADIYTVSKLLGHKHIKTTQIYAKVVDTKKIDAVMSLDF